MRDNCILTAARFCSCGPFTHQDAPWGRTDRADTLTDSCGLRKQVVAGGR